MTDCRECGKTLSDQAPSCLSCGAPNKAFNKPMGGCLKVVIVGAGILILLILFIIYGATLPGRKGEQSARDAITYCKDQVSNPSLDPATQRFQSHVCDKMVNDFRVMYSKEP